MWLEKGEGGLRQDHLPASHPCWLAGGDAQVADEHAATGALGLM